MLSQIYFLTLHFIFISKTLVLELIILPISCLGSKKKRREKQTWANEHSLLLICLTCVFFYHLVKNANDSQNDQSTYNPVSPDNEMETTFSVFTPEAEMVAANPLYESAGLTYQGGTTENGNPLSESASLTGIGSAGAIVNPLYESTYNLTGVGGAPAVTNPLYEATPTEEEMGGEDNYGASDDEDGGDAKL